MVQPQAEEVEEDEIEEEVCDELKRLPGVYISNEVHLNKLMLLDCHAFDYLVMECSSALEMVTHRGSSGKSVFTKKAISLP
jgi:hypothetical protein